MGDSLLPGQIMENSMGPQLKGVKLLAKGQMGQ
jgi:hypothetical protein